MIRPDNPAAPTGRYVLWVDGEKLGGFDDLAHVFELIDWAYRGFEDRYSGRVRFRIEDWGVDEGAPLRVAHDRLSGGLWDALCEDAAVFAMWLDAFGWQEAQGYAPE